MLMTSSPGSGRNRNPAAILCEQLETGFLGAEQERNRVDVFVRTGADVLACRLLLRRIVERAQYRIAVANRVLEIILANLEVTRDRLQNLKARPVEPGVELLERAP